MPDTAAKVAFDNLAPQGERTEALSELQRNAVHSGLSDLLPNDAVQDVVSYIRDDLLDQEMNKAIRANVVPFPSTRSKNHERGMQSVVLDDWQLSVQGDWWERPSALGFDSMRLLCDQTPILSAVVLTRTRQVQRFCRVADKNTDAPGFEICHIDRRHQLSPEETKSIELLNRFMVNCGWEFSPRKRKALRRDSFSQLMGKAVRDSLVLDSVGIETEWKRDKNQGFDGFYLVDGGTIRLCTEEGYRGDDEIFALQVVQGRVSTAYTFEDLIYEARNPRSDVRFCGYGMPEVELMIRVVTGFLNAMTYNIKGFDQNAIPKGMLHLSGNYTQKDLESFKRYWNSMVKGVNNQWSLPVMISKDQESKASFERFGVDYNEMYFSKWMTFLASIICAIYGMSPSEINFDSFTGGNTSALSGSDTSEKLAASKDSGLRPLLSYFESLFTDYIAQDFSDKYIFRWTGLDPADAQQKHEIRKMVLTINEARAEEGYEAMEGPLGEAPLNPSLIGPWMQLTQQQEEPDYGQPPGGGGGGGGGEDDGGGEDGDEGPPDDDQDNDEREQQAQEDQDAPVGNAPEKREPIFKANPNHDLDTGRFSSVFAPKRQKNERRGTTSSALLLLPYHIETLADATADRLLATKPVVLPVRKEDVRKKALEFSRKTSRYMKEKGLAIINHSSGALIELSVSGLRHAKSMSGDDRAALLMFKLPSALSRAVYFKSERPDARKAGQKNIVAYHKFAVPVRDGNSLALAVLHVEEDMHGHFYYDAAVSPEIERSASCASGVTGQHNQSSTQPRRSYKEHIKSVLESKPGLGEIHSFFRKSLACWADVPDTRDGLAAPTPQPLRVRDDSGGESTINGLDSPVNASSLDFGTPQSAIYVLE